MRHMCIPESTAHLSFHAHSIHTPMTGIPELSPPQKRIQSLNLCIFYMHNHIKCCQIHFFHILGFLPSFSRHGIIQTSLAFAHMAERKRSIIFMGGCSPLQMMNPVKKLMHIKKNTEHCGEACRMTGFLRNFVLDFRPGRTLLLPCNDEKHLSSLHRYHELHHKQLPCRHHDGGTCAYSM